MPNYNVAIKQLWNDGYEFTSTYSITVNRANGWWDAVGQAAEELCTVKSMYHVKDAEIVGLWEAGLVPKQPEVTLEDLAAQVSSKPIFTLGEFAPEMFR